MQRSPFTSSGTSFHQFPVLLTRYNCLQLILCFRKPLRGLCRWGHLHTHASAHPCICTPMHLHTLTTAHRKGMQRSPFASSGTSFHQFPVLLMRYNYLQLILCFRKPLRGLCRWGHLHTHASAHPYYCTPMHLYTLSTTHRKGMQRSPFASSGTSFHLFP